MEITIKIGGQAVSVEVSYEVYECLCESDRKNLIIESVAGVNYRILDSEAEFSS